MIRLGGVLLALAFAGSAFPQGATRSFGSVVFPGGTSATSPGITRTFGSVVFPGGSPTSPPVRSGTPVPPTIAIHPSGGFSGGNSFNHGNSFNGGNVYNRPGNVNRDRGRNVRAPIVYSYPVYVPGYYDPSFGDGYVPATQPTPQQPDVNVVYPPQQQEVRPIIIQMPPDSEYGRAARRPAPPADSANAEPAETPHYLMAFKDHTVCTAVAYWFDGDTLHYFTNGETHNQAPVALLDRDLTERLNREMGIDFKFPK